jgi:hypothetical protein
MSFEDRLLNDPNIRKSIEESGQAYPAGNAEAVMEAMRRGPVQKRGRPKGATAEDSIRELIPPASSTVYGKPFNDDPAMLRSARSGMRDGYPVPFDTDADDVLDPSVLGEFNPNQRALMEELGRNNWLGFDYPSQAADAVLSPNAHNWEMTRALADARDRLIRSYGGPPPASRPPRQMELPLGEEPTGMIPYGVRGPGVPHGGLMGPGTIFDSGARGMVPAPMRGLPAPGPTGMVPQRATDASPREYRVVDEVPQTGGLRQLAGAAAAGLGAAAGVRMGLDALGPTEPEANADLVAESRPGPSVGVTDEVPEPTTLQAPRDYSMEARALINRLNDMRRAAGGEVPEAPAMMQEVNRLLAMGNQTRQATYAAAPQDDPSRMFQQAQGLIDQVNQMYRQGMSPNSPEAQRIMAQVRQLQAQGDAIRNRRAG